MREITAKFGNDEDKSVNKNNKRIFFIDEFSTPNTGSLRCSFDMVVVHISHSGCYFAF